MNRILSRQIGERGIEAKEIPGFDGEYIFTTDRVVYRVWPYAAHTANNGWQKRFRLKEILPRGRSQMVCLSASGRRVEVSIGTLTRKVFPS